MIRGEADINKTNDVLREILQHEGNEILYFVPEDRAHALIARIRVRLSRARQALRRQGRLVRRFRLCCRLAANAGEGPGETALLCWIDQTEIERHADEIERTLVLGE